MKLKMLHLLLLFLATGLFVSSKETDFAKSKCCYLKGELQKSKTVTVKKEQKKNAGCSHTLVPGSYIFYYL